MILRTVFFGLGTIGRGLTETLSARSSAMGASRTEVRLVGVADSKSVAYDENGLDLARLLARKSKTGRVGDAEMSARELLNKTGCDVVVELTPGTTDGEPALTRIREALRSSVSVVTANKMPLALRYRELLREAERRGVRLLYGACVGGGLPVLDFGSDCAAVEPVDGIDTALNATTNFVLTRMEGGESYGTALELAQRLGYAEPDPSFDVDGLDAACKIVILANHVMKKGYSLRDVKPLVGISRVTVARMMAARKRGKAVRLVGRTTGSLSVRPVEVPASSALAAAGPSQSAVFHCRYSGARSVAGTGAGRITTSLALLRDMLAVAGER